MNWKRLAPDSYTMWGEASDSSATSLHAARILGFLDSGGAMSKTDVSSKIFGRNLSASEIDAAILLLCREGAVEVFHQVNGNGRHRMMLRAVTGNT